MLDTEPSEEFLHEGSMQLSRANSFFKEENLAVEKSHLESLLENQGEKAIEIFSSRFLLSPALLADN